ncbi:MAG: sigma-54 dependent transcriptional regulator, partial [Firmicutes bacterium]|nr:sigma-54 dependent transcriptional regulator [Bacillota bacterium]
EIPVILMTAYGSTEVPIQAMKLGAFEYIVKPFKLNDLFLIINKASAVQRLNSEVAALRKELGQCDPPSAMIGQSVIMQEVYKTIGRVARTDVTVLIQGESGTGKELVARAIHQNSDRQNQPFIKINCAAIPENLLETELFGHEKGAFTGAGIRRLGKFEIASRGTIFLDEIGEMSMSIQAKILRVLQDREFERIGGNQTQKADVRIVAATNKNLKEAIKEGFFREDLFFRLNVVNIWIPPLRDHMDDVPEMISYFLNKYSRQFNKKVQGVSKDALQKLMSYDWPGNIRELQNVCERAIVMATGLVITPEDLPYNISAYKEGLDLTPRGMSLREIMMDLERQVILNALRENNWNRTATAHRLGISRRSLYDKIKQLHLEE